MLKKILCLILNLLVINVLATDESKPVDQKYENIFHAAICVSDSPRSVARVLEPYVEQINDKNHRSSNETAMHYAVIGYKVHVVKWLLGRGARIDIRDGYGRTALERAAGYRDRLQCTLDNYEDIKAGRHGNMFFVESYGRHILVDSTFTMSPASEYEESVRKLDIIIADLTKRE